MGTETRAPPPAESVQPVRMQWWLGPGLKQTDRRHLEEPAKSRTLWLSEWYCPDVHFLALTNAGQQREMLTSEEAGGGRYYLCSFSLNPELVQNNEVFLTR